MRTIALACALVCVAAPALAQDPSAQPAPYDVPAEPSAPRPPAVTFAPIPERDAPAAPAEEPRGTRVDLGVATEFPISVGAYAGVELPGRLLLQLGAGVMPGAYVSAIDGFLTGVGAYDSTVSSFIKNALTDSFVLRASAGWRPFSGHGLELLGGYTLVTLGGSAAEGDIVNAVLAEAGSSQRVAAGSGPSVPLGATMHNVHVSLGWRWLLAEDHLAIRASVTYLQCLASSFHVGVPNASGSQMEATLNQDVNAYLQPYFSKYGKAPLLGLSAAYRF
jgi:hypothetical protein